MSLFPDREQRRANRRPSLAKVLGTGVLLGVVVYLAGVAGLTRDASVVHAVVTALLFILLLGGMSLVLRSKDRRHAKNAT